MKYLNKLIGVLFLLLGGLNLAEGVRSKRWVDYVLAFCDFALGIVNLLLTKCECKCKCECECEPACECGQETEE